MKKSVRNWGIAVGAVMSLAACGGGSVCDDASSSVSSYNQKASACSGYSATFDKNACETAVKNCSDSDQTAIKNYFACLGNVQACVSGQEATFDQELSDCASQNLANISQACISGFGG